MKESLFSFICTLVLCFSSCTPNPNPPVTDNGLSLKLLSVEANSITCCLTIGKTLDVNFAGISCSQNGTENSVDVYMQETPDDGEHIMVVKNLLKNETYTLVAFADIAGQDKFAYSNTIEATTGDPVALLIDGATENSITIRLRLNSPMECYMKGFTYKKKSSKDDPVTIYLEDNEKESVYTIDNLDKYTTYTFKGFAQLEGSEGFDFSDEVDGFTGTVELGGDYKLVFSDEFEGTGYPNTAVWSFEQGEYIRNNEPQFYSRSAENAYMEGGYLHIVARKDHLGSDGKVHNYTSASMTTSRSFIFCYGRVEVRAKIPTGSGMWPAIWTVGNGYNWPFGGELDIMEYYREKILANAAWGSTRQWTAVWDGSSKPMSYFESKNPNWRNEFHIWVTEWDEDYIRIYLDGDLMNEIDLSRTFNQGGYQNNYENPFRYHKDGWGHYLWLNLALGGNNGGSIDNSLLPAEYLVDYVRVYQKQRLPN